MEAVNNFSLIQKVQQGIHVTDFDELMLQSGFSKSELSRLIGVDPKTIDNYRKSDKPFEMLKGELLLKLARLFNLGVEVFGGADEFRDWLHLPAGEFNQARPIFLLSTSTGVDLVEEQLERIAQGYSV